MTEIELEQQIRALVDNTCRLVVEHVVAETHTDMTDEDFSAIGFAYIDEGAERILELIPKYKQIEAGTWCEAHQKHINWPRHRFSNRCGELKPVFIKEEQ